MTPGVEIACVQGEWPLLREKLLGRALAGNLVTDAWIAAGVQSLGEHLVSFDRDFRKLLPARDLSLLSIEGLQTLR
jgi:predicted nucleic acid-binding protein